jgi:23S rRNA (adenine2503-C2)-methyltransferase
MTFEPTIDERIAQSGEMKDTTKVDIASLSLSALKALLVDSFGEKGFRGEQIFRWIHQRQATAFEEMTDLPKALLAKLQAQAVIRHVVCDLQQVSRDGTVKYRFKTVDNKLIESVYMPSPDRKTLCVSTQVGCAMGCKFCATATLGLKRHLTPSEIVAQVHAVNREIRQHIGQAALRPLTNLVFMGMGEPLHNFDNVKQAIDLLQHPAGPNFSARHITVSTVGLVPQIERFGAETNVKLAISLNASDDETRSRIMPVNKRYPISALIDAVKRFPSKQGRRVTFEYVLMENVNDRREDAMRLIAQLKGLPVKVNLIQYNTNPGLGFGSTEDSSAERFRQWLEAGSVVALIRKNRGRDIAAACGQLANANAPSAGHTDQRSGPDT